MDGKRKPYEHEPAKIAEAVFWQMYNLNRFDDYQTYINGDDDFRKAYSNDKRGEAFRMAKSLFNWIDLDNLNKDQEAEFYQEFSLQLTKFLVEKYKGTWESYLLEKQEVIFLEQPSKKIKPLLEEPQKAKPTKIIEDDSHEIDEFLAGNKRTLIEIFQKNLDLFEIFKEIQNEIMIEDIFKSVPEGTTRAKYIFASAKVLVEEALKKNIQIIPKKNSIFTSTAEGQKAESYEKDFADLNYATVSFLDNMLPREERGEGKYFRR